MVIVRVVSAVGIIVMISKVSISGTSISRESGVTGTVIVVTV